MAKKTKTGTPAHDASYSFWDGYEACHDDICTGLDSGRGWFDVRLECSRKIARGNLPTNGEGSEYWRGYAAAFADRQALPGQSDLQIRAELERRLAEGRAASPAPTEDSQPGGAVVDA